MAFGTDESVLFREVSLIQGVLIERFHCNTYYAAMDDNVWSIDRLSTNQITCTCTGRLT